MNKEELKNRFVARYCGKSIAFRNQEELLSFANRCRHLGIYGHSDKDLVDIWNKLGLQLRAAIGCINHTDIEDTYVFSLIRAVLPDAWEAEGSCHPRIMYDALEVDPV
jgi:hypothetical protein